MFTALFLHCSGLSVIKVKIDCASSLQAVTCLLISIFFSSHVSQASGFHVVSNTHKSHQPIAPKEKSYSSCRKNQKVSSSVGENYFFPEKHIITKSLPVVTSFFLFVCFFPVHSQPGSGQGSPCGLDQVPSPQSLISSSSALLVKNEQNQVCVCVSLMFFRLNMMP